MVRKKLDNRIRTLIENGVATGHRSIFVIIGDKAKDQVVILHHILSKATVSARPSVLWCYKKELGFSSHRKKRMRELQKKIKTGRLNVNEDDPFELFIASTQIRYCYYAETHKILGNTFGMVVLQDFEALTPNLLARSVETVEGGGLVVILLRSMSSVRQLYTLAMDVHARYRTESHQDVVGRFNERFLLSLASCKSCLAVDDQLNILPLSTHANTIAALPPATKDEPAATDKELAGIKESVQDTKPIGPLISRCRTACQAKVLLRLLDEITEKTLKATVSITAARGRGKSAALGLAVSGAVAFGYSNIFVTSPSPENLKTLFEFVLKGFDALDYQEHIDYELIQSTNPEFNKAVIRVNVLRESHRQTIQYIHPNDSAKLGQAELLIIDEAAAIPLPLVKQLLGPYLVFLASTINGYEGTGRSLSLKLLQQLRQQAAPNSTEKQQMNLDTGAGGRKLHELVLEESIRYKPGDPVEIWLNQVLCLDANCVARISSGCPSPKQCDLYYVSRDTLFSFHTASEAFLQRLMSIYVAAHYKNTPNDLQMLSDAPAHHLFCLLGPVKSQQTHLPEILVVMQICLEGEISKQSVKSSLSRGKRASGDMIPWTVAQQFQDNDFPSLSGARVVRIATHPDYQGMGYGSRALELLQEYYSGKVTNVGDENTETGDVEPIEDSASVDLLEERPAPRNNLPPLLLRLTERKPESLDYLGVAFGLTLPLLKFWKRAGYAPVYLRQTANDLTGEHSCLMIKRLILDEGPQNDWLTAYWTDFRRRLVNLFAFEFSNFPPSLALSLLEQKRLAQTPTELGREELGIHLSDFDLKRLELYAQNMVDHHLVTDLVPRVAQLYFTAKSGEVSLNAAQSAILLGVGLQHKTMDSIASELTLPINQILAFFNKSMRKFVEYFNGICAKAIDIPALAVTKKVTGARPTKISLEDDLAEVEKEFHEKQAKDKEKVNEADLEQFAIKGTEDDWEKALENVEVGEKGGIVSVKRIEEAPKKRKTYDFEKEPRSEKKISKKKKKRKHSL